LEINNWFDLIIYSSFTLASITIGIPMILYLWQRGIDGWIKFGCCTKLPNYFIDSGWGKTALELLFIGLFMTVGTIWYLFIDKGGHLFFWFNEVKEFF